MGRSVDPEPKQERVQIRMTDKDRAKIEDARLRLQPRMQLQEFILKLIDDGMKIADEEEQVLREYRAKKAGESKLEQSGQLGNVAG